MTELAVVLDVDAIQDQGQTCLQVQLVQMCEVLLSALLLLDALL
jgi:hypothetical protein